MKKLFTMLMVAAAATGTVFTSCSKDDDQAPDPAKAPKYVVANDKSWVFTQVKQGADGEYGPEADGGITFKADGTFESTNPMFSSFEAGTKYSYDGENTITIKGKDLEAHGREVTVTITIVSLTADAFEIQVKRKGRDPMNPNYEDNVSFKGSFR